MFKIYERYIVKKFFNKFLIISFIFFCLTIILSLFEEISFFKDLETNFILPYFLTILTAPITLFEIFPFIFLLTSQFFFYDIFKSNELNHLKNNGLSNLKIINILFICSIIIGIFTVLFYYNIASKLKFFYTDIKNDFSNDNKYLAVVTDSGLWLKDEINGSTLIIKAKLIKENFLIDVIINKFDDDFKLKNTIQSNKIDINNNSWIIYEPIITNNNVSKSDLDQINLNTNFNKDKINSLFSNISTLNIFQLFDLKKDYESLGYSSDEIKIHLLKLFSMPFFYALMTVFSSIIMFNIRRDKSFIFHLILGIFISVVIYYFNFMFVSLGNTGKLPINVSILLPMLIITMLITIGLIKVNEK